MKSRHEVVGLDPRNLLRRLQDLHHRAHSRASSARVELYCRVVVRVRVRRDGRSACAVRETGRDEGLAVRLMARDGGRLGFAAATGSGEGALEWCLSRARAGVQPLTPGLRPWAAGGREPRIDHDPEEDPPSPEALEAWLRTNLPASGRGRSGSGWIEWSRSVETLVADDDLAVSRTRNRVWAMTLLDERPVVLAARSLERLDSEPWNAPDRRSEPPGRTVDRSARDLPLVLEPAAAATLIRALVTTLCGPDEAGTPVGAGLRITNEPRHPEGLAGGSFDDAGFEARTTILADGVRTHAAGPPAGRYRRPSFRDPPSPGFGDLVVAERDDPLPRRGAWVRHLRIDAVDSERWALEAAGQTVQDGSPHRPLPPRTVLAAPADLARRCIGTAGRARACANGVVTPFLLLDGW